MVDDLAAAKVERFDLGHLLACQGEIPDIKVLLDPLLVHRFGYDRHPALDVPPQGRLGGGLAVLLADGGQNRVGDDAELALREGTPRLRDDPVFLHDLEGFLLLEEGMDLDLVDGGDDVHRLAEVEQAGGVEVADADGPHLAGAAGFLHGAVSAHIVARRLMDQVEVKVVEAEVLQGAVQRRFGGLITGVLHPQLGGDEQLFAGDAAPGDGRAHGLFVHVGGGRVDQPVTGCDGVQDGLFTLGRVGHLKDAEALQGHDHAVVQSDRFHKSLLFASGIVFACKERIAQKRTNVQHLFCIDVCAK